MGMYSILSGFLKTLSTVKHAHNEVPGTDDFASL